MTLQVPEDIATSAEQLSAGSGSSPEQLLLAALRAHFPPIPPELQEELDAWERASDEDMAKFDALLDAE